MKFFSTSLRVFLSVQITLRAAEKNASAAKPPSVELELQASHRLLKEDWYTNRDCGVQGSSSQSGALEEAPSVFQSLSCRLFFFFFGKGITNGQLQSWCHCLNYQPESSNKIFLTLIPTLFHLNSFSRCLILRKLLLRHSNSPRFFTTPDFRLAEFRHSIE